MGALVGDKQCSYFEDQAKCQGASLVSLPAPLADAAPVGNKYCCGYAVAGSCSGSHDVTKLTVDFKSLTAIDIQVTIDGTDSNCPAEAIAYNHTSGAVTFPGIAGPNDCLGKIDSGNGIDTPVVAYDHTQDVVRVGHVGAERIYMCRADLPTPRGAARPAHGFGGLVVEDEVDLLVRLPLALFAHESRQGADGERAGVQLLGLEAVEHCNTGAFTRLRAVEMSYAEV